MSKDKEQDTLPSWLSPKLAELYYPDLLPPMEDGSGPLIDSTPISWPLLNSLARLPVESLKELAHLSLPNLKLELRGKPTLITALLAMAITLSSCGPLTTVEKKLGLKKEPDTVLSLPSTIKVAEADLTNRDSVIALPARERLRREIGAAKIEKIESLRDIIGSGPDLGLVYVEARMKEDSSETSHLILIYDHDRKVAFAYPSSAIALYDGSEGDRSKPDFAYVVAASTPYLYLYYNEAVYTPEINAEWERWETLSLEEKNALLSKMADIAFKNGDIERVVVVNPLTGEKTVYHLEKSKPGEQKNDFFGGFLGKLVVGEAQAAESTPTPTATATSTPTTAPTATATEVPATPIITPTPTETATPAYEKAVAPVDTTLYAGPGTNYPHDGELRQNESRDILGKAKSVDGKDQWWFLLEGDAWVKESSIVGNPDLDAIPLVTAEQIPPTPTPEVKVQQNPQGEFIYRNKETGVEIKVPKVIGTRREVMTIQPGSKLAEQLPALAKEGSVVIYRTEANNPYGLEKGVVAGVFYPETYVVPNEKNPPVEQKGAVGLRAEVVRYFLKQVGSPEKAAIIPLPFDVTTASAETQFLVQFEKTNAPKGADWIYDDIFLSVPVGSKLVDPLIDQRDNSISFNNQSWGGSTIGIGEPGIFPSQYKPKYILNFYYAVHSAGPRQARLGQSLLEIETARFDSATIAFYNAHRVVKLLDDRNHPINFKFAGKVIFPVDGKFPVLSFTKENLLNANGVMIFILANDNPLIGLPAKAQRPTPVETTGTKIDDPYIRLLMDKWSMDPVALGLVKPIRDRSDRRREVKQQREAAFKAENNGIISAKAHANQRHSA